MSERNTPDLLGRPTDVAPVEEIVRGGVAVESAGTPRAARGVRARVIIWALRVAILAVLLGTWQWYGATTGGAFVPSMTDTVGRLPDLFSSGGLGHALWASNEALLIGYPIAAVVGTAFGLLLGRVRTADRALSYWIDIAMVIPMVSIIPVIIVALGLNLTARVTVVVLFGLPVIALNSRAAVRVVPRDLVEMARSFGASRRQVWLSIIIPGAFSQMFTGLRIGLGQAISGMIVVELTLVPAGLGGLLLDFKSAFAASDLYAVTLVVVLEGVILTSIGHSIERRVSARMRGNSR